jgi:hypothetical protein
VPDTDDIDIESLAKAMRAKAENPEQLAAFENIIAHIKRSPPYYAALGRFVSKFAQVETILQTSLWMIARIKPPIAPAIFNGFKIEGCLGTIKRIADAKNWSARKKDQLEEITNRLGPINRLRNDILHYGATIDLSAEDVWLLSNKRYVHIPQKIRETWITPTLLDNATSDLNKLFYLIVLLALDVRGSVKAARSTRKALEPLGPKALASAWLYKPPPPIMTADTIQKTRQKRPRRRPASRGKL